MGVVHVEHGYLDEPYLLRDYDVPIVYAALGSQFNATIDYRVALGAQMQGKIDAVRAVAIQLQALINKTVGSALQTESHINDRRSSLANQFTGSIPDNKTQVAQQFSGLITPSIPSCAQLLASIVDHRMAVGGQFSAKIDAQKTIASQFTSLINQNNIVGTQFSGTINKNNASAAQVNIVLTPRLEAASQFIGRITTDDATAMQLVAIITKIHNLASQFEAHIINANTATGLQSEGIIASAKTAAAQLTSVINSIDAIAVQYRAMIINALGTSATQLQGIIASINALGIQFKGVITSSSETATQFDARLTHYNGVGTEVNNQIYDIKRVECQQFISAPYVHRWTNYLVDEYLVGPYFVKNFTVHVGCQFNAIIKEDAFAAGQFKGLITKYTASAGQFKGTIINASNALAAQFISIRPFAQASQFRAALYNTDNLRILDTFPSRGTDGLNWTSSSTASGDFSINNVNTDIVEQVWRSQTGAITGVQLTCDTGAGENVYLDTLAILNHNLTTSATVLIEGDDDPAFGSPGFSHTLPMTQTNAYYIAPSLPLDGFRYWRFSIDDSTNTSGYLQIGAILFGEATIFVGECFSNPLRLKNKHFSDKVMTEGFTNVSNDRAYKRSISLDFKNLLISGGNYTNLSGIFESARTNLKLLWIPTPNYPARYAVFGKLQTIPDEEHNDLGLGQDYVNLNVEVDESL